MTPLAKIEQLIVSELLSSQTQQQYASGDVAKRELAPYVKALQLISAAYLSHESGSKLTSPIDSQTAAAAYALYYTPINAAKLIHCLPLLHVNHRPLRVLDLGCGPGTAGLALRACLTMPIALTCVEHSSHMRTLARQLLSSCRNIPPLEGLTIHSSLREIRATLATDNYFDLVIAANVFAELEYNQAVETLDTLAQLVATDGTLVLLEPGQPHHTRRLMALRDRVTTNHQRLTPVFPCLRADPCPMLAQSSSDWCHGVLEWQQPPLHRQLDQLLGFNKHRIKFSCFIFRDGAPLGTGLRVLTPPEKSRGGVAALVCGKDTYGISRVPKRPRSEATRAFEKARVFDLVQT
jgi:ribosomal protein RSM22 (predicted rRNA methylase)